MSYKLHAFDADSTLRVGTVPGQVCPNGPDEWAVIPGVAEKLATIDWTKAHFGIASNQWGVALGFLTEQTAHRLLMALATTLLQRPSPPAAVQLCPHAPEAACTCRKPAPGMLLALMRAHEVLPAHMVYVGNQDSDRLVAERAGCAFEWAWDFFGHTKDAWEALCERTKSAGRAEVGR